MSTFSSRFLAGACGLSLIILALALVQNVFRSPKVIKDYLLNPVAELEARPCPSMRVNTVTIDRVGHRYLFST